MSSPKRDYYEILGLAKTSAAQYTPGEIKDAYKNMAKKFHPDKASPDLKEEYTQKFHLIGEAYAVLSDPEKKQIYDTTGSYSKDSLAQGNPFGQNAFDMFASVFSNFKFGFGGGMQGNNQKPMPIYHQVDVNLRDFYVGRRVKLNITRKAVFKGNSTEPLKTNELKDTWESCTGCKGQGVTIQMTRMGPFVQSVQNICGTCQGSKYMLKFTYTIKDHTELVEFEIDPGMSADTQIKFEGRGDCLPGVLPGDVVIGLRELPHPSFKRVGSDLHMTKAVPLVDALCGFKFSLKHLDDRVLHLQSKHIITIKEPTRLIKGEGMVSKGGSKGNLVINFEIQLPTHLLADQRTSIKQILGSDSISENELVEPTVLDAVFR